MIQNPYLLHYDDDDILRSGVYNHQNLVIPGRQVRTPNRCWCNRCLLGEFIIDKVCLTMKIR